MPTVATLNLFHHKSRASKFADLEKVMKFNPGILNLQEVSPNQGKYLAKWFAERGYGFKMQNDVPIAYDIKRYKMVDSGSRFLTPATNVGHAGAGPDTLRRKEANWIALEDRVTGKMHVATNAHFAPSIQLGGKRAALHRAQVRGVAQLQRDLKQQFKGASLYVMGDFNTGKAGKLGAISKAGLTAYRAPEKTHRVGYPDWILSNRKALSREVLGGLNTDHNAYIATFGRDAAGHGGGTPNPDPGNPGNNPGNGGGSVPLSAFDLFNDLLDSWGVPIGSDIEKIIRDAVIEGVKPGDIGLIIPQIQETKSWKKRFPGWAARVANGYNQLSVDEYLQLENQYHTIMAQAGLPKGFYDQPADFGSWIANNVSPDEINNRVTLAVKTAQTVDPTMRDLMAKFYGLGTGDVAAYFLDQKRALPVIERQYTSAGVASWAVRNGFGANGIRHYERLVDDGVTVDQAAAGYGTVKALTDTVGQVASVYGESYDQSDAEQDVFFNKSEKRRRIMANEQATFGGTSQGSTGSAKRQSY